jgi:G3E family GTPase
VQVDVVSGYLGAGKTTCLQAIIAAEPDPGGLAVLVNEFGDIGVDALLLEGATDVIELSSGCICCTLRLDFRQQILEIAQRWRPRRLLVEPTGVATTSQVLRALRHPDLAPIVEGVRVIVLVDAVTFAQRLKESPAFFTAQVASADVILLNKTDLVPESRVKALSAALEDMNPTAWVIPTVRGRLPQADLLPPPRALEEPEEATVIEGLQSQSFLLDERVPLARARAFFEGLARGRFGVVERAKGVVQTDEGWRRLDVASGMVDVEPWTRVPQARVVVIGRELDLDELQAAVAGLSEEV